MRDSYFLAGFITGGIAMAIGHNSDVAWYIAFVIGVIVCVCGIFTARKVLQ